MSSTLLLQAFTSGLLMGGVYGLIAIGLSLIFGVMRVINFAHGEMMVLGMYISFWAFALLNLDPYATIAINAAVLFGLGFLVQRFLVNRVLEVPEEIQVLLLIGLGLVIQNSIRAAFGPDFRTVTTSYSLTAFSLAGITIDLTRLNAFALAMLFTGVLYLFLKKTDLGKSVRACADNRLGALLTGTDVTRVYAVSFGIGAACVGAAAALLVTFLDVYPYAGHGFTMTSFVVVILGGMGSLPGALLGGLVVGVAESVAAVLILPSLKELASFSILVLILLFRPQGIFGTGR